MLSRSAAVLIFASLILIPAHGQGAGRPANSPLPAVTPPNRPSVGLALEGGGALGLAHVGVLKWFEENRIPVDRIAGTSMGSLAAALYATGHTPDEMRALAVSDAFLGVFTLETPYADSSFRRRQDRHELPQAIGIGLKHGPLVRNALLTDRGVNEFLSNNMAAFNRQDLDYNQLPIPFRCVATDLNTLQSFTFASGPIPGAVRASISIPGVFPPVQDRNGHYLVDGGILDNLPTDVVKRDLRADIVIAVRLEDSALSGVDTSSIVGVLNRAFSAGIVHNVEQAERLADLVVRVPVGSFSATDYAKAGQLVDAGYKAAEQNRATLLKYALDEEDWKAYLAARESRRQAQPGVLHPAVVRDLRVEGGEPGANRQVLSDMKPLAGHPLSAAATLNALKPIQSNGGYSATWETFNQATADSALAVSGPPGGNPMSGILVRLSRDPTGPPYLLIDPEMAASTSNITREQMALRLVDQNLGGFGSELRADVRIGYMTDLSAEYYRMLSPGGYFIEPRAGVVREPVYIWANQKRIAERFEQNLEAGLEAGRTFSNQLQVSALWRAQDTRWSLRTGSDGGGYLSGTAQTGLLKFDMDKAAAGVVSPRGFRLSASVGAFYHAAGSNNAPLAKLSFIRSRSYNQRNIFSISGEINSYLRANVAQPYRFTLGGPTRLSASSFDEYRGTDTYLSRLGYLHRIAPLPTGLGQGLYAVFGYEAGEIWSPEAHSILRQDGTTGLLANTPLGLVTFGVSVGDAGHRKVFVTLGRWF